MNAWRILERGGTGFNLVDVREDALGGSRFVCEALREDAERIVADHGSAERERLRAALAACLAVTQHALRGDGSEYEALRYVEREATKVLAATEANK